MTGTELLERSQFVKDRKPLTSEATTECRRWVSLYLESDNRRSNCWKQLRSRARALPVMIQIESKIESVLWTQIDLKTCWRWTPSYCRILFRKNDWVCRQVLGARLESVYTSNRIVGSNPTLSAINLSFSIPKCAIKIGLITMWSQMKKIFIYTF